MLCDEPHLCISVEKCIFNRALTKEDYYKYLKEIPVNLLSCKNKKELYNNLIREQILDHIYNCQSEYHKKNYEKLKEKENKHKECGCKIDKRVLKNTNETNWKKVADHYKYMYEKEKNKTNFCKKLIDDLICVVENLIQTIKLLIKLKNTYYYEIKRLRGEVKSFDGVSESYDEAVDVIKDMDDALDQKDERIKYLEERLNYAIDSLSKKQDENKTSKKKFLKNIDKVLSEKEYAFLSENKKRWIKCLMNMS